jgi:hypothetical protein
MLVSDQPAIKETSSKSPRARWFWAAIFIIAMVGGILGAKALHLGPYVTMGVIASAMLLLIPLVRAAEKAQADDGCASPASRRYNRRMLVWSFSYMVALFAAICAQRLLHPDGIVLATVAMLPALPILIMLWAMKCYLTEEQDEYLRLRFTHAALIGTGILLALATVWGFLETFHVVPHAAGWIAVPVWAVGVGLGGWIVRRGEA